MAKIARDTQRISEIFKQRLIILMDEADLELPEFCKNVNISQSVIRLAVNFGIVPSVLSIIKIVEFCDASFDYIVGESDKNDFIKSLTPTCFHERYKLLRDEKGVKDSQVASVMSFSRNFISEWMRNKTLPSIDYLKAIAKYFNVSIDYLLGRTDYR